MTQIKEQSECLANTPGQQHFSLPMQIGFGYTSNGRLLKTACCIALYSVLALILTPGFKLNSQLLFAEEETQQKRRTIRLLPKKPATTTLHTEQSKKTLLTLEAGPLAPEPKIEALSLDETISIHDTDEWEISQPHAAPGQDKIAFVGTPGVEAPVFTRKVQPIYPKKGATIGIQGYVVLQAILRKDGTVDDIEVLRGLGRGKYGFENQAIASLQRWEFIPGSVNGQPADVRMNLRVDFVLN